MSGKGETRFLSRCKIFITCFIYFCYVCRNVESKDVFKSENKVIQHMKQGLIEDNLLYGLISASAETGGKSICAKHLKIIDNAISEKKFWALRMIDSSGHEDLAYLFGNSAMMGSRTQCYEINEKEPLNILNPQQPKNDSNSPFEVKFMSAFFKHSNPVQVQLNFEFNYNLQTGFCMPNSCTNEEISHLLNHMLSVKKLTYLKKYPVKLNLLIVKSPLPKSVIFFGEQKYIAFMAFCVILFIITLAATYYDEIVRQPKMKKIEELNSKRKNNNNAQDNTSNKIETSSENKLWQRILLCFSLSNNIRSLFKIKDTKDSLAPIHGLKVLGTMGVVMVHRPVFNSCILDNVYVINRGLSKFLFMYMKRSHLIVDMQFCLGGFIVSYLFCKTFMGKKQMKFVQSVAFFFKMLVHRLLRLFPLYIFTMLLSMLVWRVVENSNPLFELLFQTENTCKRTWWRNFLFISTFFYTWRDHCMMWSWYITADMQYYIINCILLVIALKYFKLSQNIMKIMIVTSMIVTFVVSYVIKFRITLDFVGQDAYSYFVPYGRIPSYFIGALGGTMFYKWNGKLPLNKAQIRYGWISYFCLMYYSLWGLWYPQKASFLANALFFSTVRAAYSLVILWALMSSLSGCAGIIGRFLSFRGFVPLGRLSYSVYLSNLIICYAVGFSADLFENQAFEKEIISGPGTVGLCFCFGTILALFIEIPFSKLINAFSDGSGKKKSPKKECKSNEKLEINGNSHKIPLKVE